jgi:hypothetical protein
MSTRTYRDNRKPSGDVEPGGTHQRSFECLKSTDVGSGRAHAQARCQFAELLGRPVRMHFHATVIKISNPPGHTNFVSGTFGKIAESDSLNTTGNQESFCYQSRPFSNLT